VVGPEVEDRVVARLLDLGEQVRCFSYIDDVVPSLALLAENLEDMIATVFRQVAMNRFEDLVHTARREQGELSVERFGELWAESQSELLGDSVELTEGYNRY